MQLTTTTNSNKLTRVSHYRIDWQKITKEHWKDIQSNLGSDLYSMEAMEIVISGTETPILEMPPNKAKAATMVAIKGLLVLYMRCQESKLEDMLLNKLVDIVYNKFGFISIKELDQAFSLATFGKLGNIDLSAYYGQADIKTVVEVLESYKKYRAKLIQTAQDAVNALKTEEEKMQLAAAKNPQARAAFCKQIKTWLAMSKEGFYPFETWREIPSTKVQIAIEDQEFNPPIELKKEIWTKSKDITLNTIKLNKGAEIARGQAGAVQLKDIIQKISEGIKPKGFDAKRKVIYAQLLLWEFVKPKN